MLSCVQLLCVYILALSSKIILMLFVFTAYKLLLVCFIWFES